VSPFDLFDTVNGEWVGRQYLDRNPVSEELGKILDRTIQNLLKDRFQTAAEVSTALTTPALVTAAVSPAKTAVNSQRQVAATPPSNPRKFTHSQNYPSIEIAACECITVRRDGRVTSNQQHQIRYFRELLGGNFWKKQYLEMACIPGGNFVMGASDSEAKFAQTARPQHPVKIQPFYMSRYPITQLQYQSLMGNNPAYFTGDLYPVENVDYVRAVEFCKKLAAKTGRDYRLPSEAEWEYACRAGTTTPFHYGATLMSDFANCDGRESYERAPESECCYSTTAVGSFSPNAFGLYDMHGNVWEWCSDHWQENYQQANDDGKPWLNGDRNYRVLRGGSWSSPPCDCRSASRCPMSTLYRDRTTGFRVALT
jgi:formylglycine-generating enzyme required for sulfatase activity